jgi:hypothetical protein
MFPVLGGAVANTELLLRSCSPARKFAPKSCGAHPHRNTSEAGLRDVFASLFALNARTTLPVYTVILPQHLVRVADPIALPGCPLWEVRELDRETHETS